MADHRPGTVDYHHQRVADLPAGDLEAADRYQAIAKRLGRNRALPNGKAMRIDLNADLAEGLPDAEVMALVTSANVACGCHAGGSKEMMTCLELARKHRVRIGAHPGYADREHFGRQEMDISPDDLRDLLEYQIGALAALCELAGVDIKYVKAHGAMYHQTSLDKPLGLSLLLTAKRHRLAVVGLPGTMLEQLAGHLGVPYIREGFADRRYRANGSLVPRTEAKAMIDDPLEAAKQVQRLVKEQGVQSICVHGDTPGAVAFTKALRQQLQSERFDFVAD